MNAQEKADAVGRGYSVQLQERGPGNWSYWVYFNGNEVGGPCGAEGDAWAHVQELINRGAYGIGS